MGGGLCLGGASGVVVVGLGAELAFEVCPGRSRDFDLGLCVDCESSCQCFVMRRAVRLRRDGLGCLT